MAQNLAHTIAILSQERGISMDLVRKTIEESLVVAYQRKFGDSSNAVVRFSEDDNDVTLYARKKIVQEVEDSTTEISLNDALTHHSECEIGDELLVEIDLSLFSRGSITGAKQRVRDSFHDIQKDTQYMEFSDKVGEMIIGYYQREYNGAIYVNLGTVEGILPKRYQSPREVYRPDDRIKALIYEVHRGGSGPQIILSRTHTDFVRRIFEIEVPEIYDRTIEIYKIVREPGNRTKIAVYSHRDDVDPVGACVGLRGVRIQAIVKELEGEKIDIVHYDNDSFVFIKNALLPAAIKQIYVLNEANKVALAIVEASQLSLAIGKQGVNVRLANRLVDWNIDVKTEAQFESMGIVTDTERVTSMLFSDESAPAAAAETQESEEEETDTPESTSIEALPIDEEILEILKRNGLNFVEELFVCYERGNLNTLEGLDKEQLNTVKNIIEENVEIVEEDG